MLDVNLTKDNPGSVPGFFFYG